MIEILMVVLAWIIGAASASFFYMAKINKQNAEIRNLQVGLSVAGDTILNQYEEIGKIFQKHAEIKESILN